MKKLAATFGVAGLGFSVIAAGSISEAADHRDSTLLAMAASSAADINDVYTWMSADAGDLNLVMTVQPFAAAGATFSDNVQYVFHVHSMATFGAVTSTETQIICEFAGAASVQCWVGDDAYLTGDPSAAAGLTSDDGLVRVFAGQRNDPFYFNLDGFQAVVAGVKNAAAGLTFDEAGCPALDEGTSTALVAQLGSNAPGNTGPLDDFEGANVAALVIQVDKSLVTGGGPILAVWGSTHSKP